MLKNVNALLRTGLLSGLLILVGWWTWILRGEIGEHERTLAAKNDEITELSTRVEARDTQIRDLGVTLQKRDTRIREQDVELEEAALEIQSLDTAMRLLKVDHRVAEIEVLSQGSKGDAPEQIRTLVRFTELDSDGNPLGDPLEATVEGRTVYVETLVVKFEDEFVEGGDSLRGTSLCLFRRLFGEDQKPSEGVPIDAAGIQPHVYGGDAPAPHLSAMWERFWEYANDPELARSKGVRAIHGEAPFIELRPGKRYRVELRASGGLTIRPTN